MKAVVGVMAGLFVLISMHAHADQPELGKYPQILKAGDYTITMLKIGKDESTVLIKVDGLDNDFDGQIFKHTKICENTTCTSYKYETVEIPGKKRWWTIQSSRPWGDYDSMIFYPPGIDKKQDVYSGKRPESFDSSRFYKEYEGQLAIRK